MRPYFILCIFLLMPLSAQAQEKLIDRSGGFSFNIPKGWESRKGDPYIYRVAGIKDKFSPVLFSTNESYPGKIDSFIEFFIERIRKNNVKTGVVSLPADFVTANGMRGKRLVVYTETFGGFATSEIRNVFFVFPSKGKMFIFGCTALNEPGAKWNSPTSKWDSVADTAAKSFKIL